MKPIQALKLSKFSFLLTLCLAYTLNLHAQTKSLVTDVFFSGGTLIMDNPRLSNLELLSLAPNSQILNANLGKYRSNGGIYDYSGIQGATFFSAQVGLNAFKSSTKKSLSPLLRIGLAMGQVNFVNEYLSYTESFPYDTLISQRTGEKTFIDSIAGSQININQQGNQIRFNLALLYQTELDRRISLYSGFELGAGLTFNNSTQIFKSEYFTGTSSSTYYYGNPNGFEWESFANKSGYLVQAGIPIGFNVRLSKQRPLLNQTMLYFEFTPGLAFYHNPALKTYSNFTYQTNVGIRFRI